MSSQRMTAKTDTHRELESTPHRHAFGLLANVMIALGVLALVMAAYNGIREANLYHSPFDEVAGPDGGEKGFLPLVMDADDEGEGAAQAPTLAAGEVDVGVDAARLAEVKAAIEAAKSQIPEGEDAEVYIPDRIVIPSLNVDAPVLLADYKEVSFWGKTYKQWMAPNRLAVGWHFDSAPLGQPGNSVLNGHHNIYGEVFRQLSEITAGSIIYLYSGGRVFSYIVVTVELLDEKYQEVEVRMENASWTAHSEDERVTLVSCWPYEGNSHRVVVVAAPIELDGAAPE